MSSLYHTPIPFGSPATSNVINTALGSLDNTIYGLISGSTPLTKLRVAASTTLTIASGSITATQTYHKVDTESAAASDDLDTIVGGAEGGYLTLELANASHAVVIKHNTGNIILSNGEDFTLSAANKVLVLFYNGTKWVDVGGAGAIEPGSKVIVSHTRLASPQSSIVLDVSSIADYALIRVFFEFRSSRSAASDTLLMTINADAGANYDYAHKILQTTLSTNISAGANNFSLNGYFPAATAVADHYGVGWIDIYNPREAVKKSIKGFYTGTDNTTYVSTAVADVSVSGLYHSIADIDTIELGFNSGDFIAGSGYHALGITLL